MTDPTPAPEHLIRTSEVAAWLAEIGFGVDFTTDAPLPDALRWPLAQAYFDKDCPGDSACYSTTSHDYYDTLAEECGWGEGVGEWVRTPRV